MNLQEHWKMFFLRISQELKQDNLVFQPQKNSESLYGSRLDQEPSDLKNTIQPTPKYPTWSMYCK